MSPRHAGLVALLALLFGPPAAGQHQTAHEIPRIPLALLERPTAIHAGVGAAHDAVHTTSVEAQRFYDQGLAYLHSYVWIEAARSLNQAARLDPQLAPVQAALSLVLVELNKPEESRAALATAQRLAATAPPHDRMHVELRARQAAAEQAPPSLAAYRSALTRAVTDFPNDVEFGLLQGLATSADPFERGQGTGPEAIPYFENARRIAPNHPGPHHYLAHAFENANRVPQALAEAREYVALAPEVPHAHHMLGHDLRRNRQVADAIAEFEAADRLERAYFAREDVPASFDWHHHHNLDLLAQSYAYVGRMTQAESSYQASFALPSNLVAQLFNKRQWPAFLRSRGRLDEALAAARVLVAHPHPLVQATGHIEVGLTLAARQDVGGAGSAFNTALQMLRASPEGAPLAAEPLLTLQGELALRTAARDKGRATFEEVVVRLRGKPGPDNWAQALFTLEAMARVARQVGDWDLAERMARHMIEHDAGYAGSHYALGLALEHAADVEGARRAFADAVVRWSAADSRLPELADARKRVGVRK